MSESLAARVADLEPRERAQIFKSLTPGERAALLYDWGFWARPEQIAPAWAWTIWLILAGRGWGKTRAGAEEVIGWAREPNIRIALVGATGPDARAIMVEGESGLLARSPPDFEPKWYPSKKELHWPNGTLGIVYSAEKPDRLRGPQHHKAWLDEPAAWKYASHAYDQLMLGLRLGSNPQAVVTTTPRPTKLIRELVAREGSDVAMTRGSTYANRDNLAEAFFSQVVNLYEGTRLGRQELYAEILADVEGALWTSALIENNRIARPADAPEQYRRIVVAIDPSWGTQGDDVGIVVAGKGFDGRGYVLDDGSGMMTPSLWGLKAAELYDARKADAIIAEANFAAEQVALVVRVTNDERRQRGLGPVQFRQVHASRGKQQRAEPVVALYEQGRISHVGTHAGLELQMTNWVPGQSDFSPGRVDALVWALTELMLTGPTGPAKVSSARATRLPSLGARR